MLIATSNVNGLRAAVRKGMQDWLSQAVPDVLLLQEVRAPADLIPDLVGSDYQVFAAPSVLAGRAGVAIALRKGITAGAVRVGLADAADTEPDVDTGRWIELDLPQYDLTVVSAYLHSGVATDAAKMAAKYAHLEKVTTRLTQIKAENDAKYFLMAGDFNIVHTPQDIKNWKSNHNKTAGVLDKEIAYLEKWFGELGFIDTQRFLLPDVAGPYTWWSQRGKAFDNDAGWRIDYHLSNPQLSDQAQKVWIDRAPSYDQRWSDHAPLLVEYNL